MTTLRRISILFIPCAMLVLLSCQETPTTPEPTVQTISMEVLRRLDLQQIYYDSLRVRNKSDLILPARWIKRIGAGTGNTTVYEELISVEPTYEGSAGNYLLKFDFKTYLDSLRIEVPFVLRYYQTDGTTTDVEMDVPAYRYPYSHTVPFMTHSNWPSNVLYLQDIDRNATKLFYHPLGPLGLFEYDLSTKQTTELVLYVAGDHIASDGQYVFYDEGHFRIRRYNLDSRTTDATLYQPSFGNSSTILGVAAREGFVHLLIRQNNTNILLKYTVDGNLLETIPYPKDSYFLTIHNNILYSLVWSTREILRFDLNTKTFLESRLAPAKNGDGIKIYQNKFYYIDYLKRFVGMIPLEDIE